MKLSVKVSLIVAAIATIGIGGIAKLVSVSAKGGLNLSRYSASATLLILMLVCIFIFSQQPAKKRH